jgi:O-acetyl-ADP-ribose deacetylase (regulator of RNase III)
MADFAFVSCGNTARKILSFYQCIFRPNGENIYCLKHIRLYLFKADVLVNSAHSNLNNLTACGRALMTRGGLSLREACKPQTQIRPGDIVTTESGNLLSKYVIHAVCCHVQQFKEASSAHQVRYNLRD